MSDYGRAGFHRPPPVDSTDDSGSDFERDDAGHRARTSTDIRQLDLKILEREEEAEELLTGQEKDKRRRGLFTRNDGPSSGVKISKRERRKYLREANRKGKKYPKEEEESVLMYDMEEGHKDSSDSANSSDADRLRLKEMPEPVERRKSRIRKLTAAHVVIVIAFIGLLLGAYKASRNYRPQVRPLVNALSNGSSIFAPTTIFISLDGFRADFLYRNITPSLSAFVQAGTSPEYMTPSFPSVTFVNHNSLVTGLYPESHGIVGNSFWDPEFKEDFFYTDPARSMQPKWWTAEPIWVTAENQDVRTAIHMWPGSEAHIGTEPTFVDKYEGHELLKNKVDRILGLLDLPGPLDKDASLDRPRPQLIAAYVPDVDRDGHLYGPNSTEIRSTISSVDAMLGQLFSGLEQRNLTDIVNIVIVSDHGMATTSTSRLVQLDDIIDMSLIERTDGWPLYGLRPKNESDIEPLYNHLKQEATNMEGFDVYLKDRDMPERYHFSHNDRIAPLWVIPWTGWAIVVKEEFNVEEAKKTGQVYHPIGVHGYDHEHPLMRAIFVARGPAFPHTPGSKLEPFQNIEVYNLVCDSIGVVPNPNNGTLRLPLKPIGLHGSMPPKNLPEDMPEDSSNSIAMSTETTIGALSSTQASRPTIATTDAAAPTRPVIHDDVSQEDEDNNGKDTNLWWDWVKGKLDGAKDWATGVYDKVSDKISGAASNSGGGDK
ncbi:Phosphodiest-domain-containing protein [Aureobasidium subglaciale]|nr:Phosphodiest-domain-containing protein [Aureobasidium subglaciale]KAI5215676.1 Phosphodiest-domain-containing protein [Aureobasidium subglaciale]KAI5218867.1 Phosphodiest-domain-containing protein [Aureobasidium subglaciale]KAI5256546.1 Phosphodiest-domain-containing protein [Aureobasidium subglaciale]